MKKLFLGVAMLMLLSLCSNANEPAIEKGVLDLSNYKWENGLVDLRGEWEFYWSKFHNHSFFSDTATPHEKTFAYVPAFWNDEVPDNGAFKPAFGYATYRLLIKCPNAANKLAIKFLTVESAYDVYINGKQTARVGNPGVSAATTTADLRPIIINVQPENGVLDIVVHVSNFNNRVGGLWDDIKLGTEKQVEYRFISNIVLECFVAGAFFLTAIYYLILYSSFRKRYTLLYFGLLCIVIFTRSMVVGEVPLYYISDWGWSVARRLEYISLYCSVPIMCLFSYHLFPHEFEKKVLYVVVPLCSLFVLLSLVGPYYYYTYVVRYFQLIILATALYGLYVYIKACIAKRAGSILFLSAFIIFLITIINDVLYVNLVIHSWPLFYVGLAIFVVKLSIILSRQFSDTFSQLQFANKKLQETNDELGIMNKEIEHKHIELKKINTELDSFVNRTSHDLRAPITSLLGIIMLAEQEQNPETMKKYLSMQEKTLKRMDSLIADIIDFSKNKRLDLELKDVEFEQIVHDSLEDHAYLNDSQKIAKIVRINQYEKFVSDPRRVSIIINNLISNAIKYADYSKLQPEIHVNVTVVDNVATLEVSDNGIGIEEKHLDKIFTLFYRVTNSATGSGLGLYIIKETVEKLGGYIIINSTKGDGTSIKVMLPNIGYRL
ncbi:sensor histidine kinase [Panacibacter sp. DH6]|uniref:histidine kinase n=1 Tax=Panacibacter microcysteis TaxID=2793269 RepID=A0A931MDJ5_9BACT|nr:sensor histidine kinase [Panacibacter microcysteis]MBG9378665.1 sensor histidine kinase [Panacibacter microcysteis]